jgi:DNA repair exonuclease SbcCD ATPase subunit
VRKSDGNVKVDVNFWTVDSDGSTINLNGEDRDKTNFIIREYFGTYDDFLMTTLSTQYDNQNFVEKAQKDRKELLYRFLDISIYEDLFAIAKIKAKEYQVLVKDMDKENLLVKSVELQQKADMFSRQVDELRSRYDINRAEWVSSIKELESLESQRLPIDAVSMVDISKTELDISNAAASLQRNISSIVELEEKKDTVQLSLSKINRDIEDLGEYSNRKEIIGIHQNLVEEQSRVEYAMKSLDTKLNDYQKKKAHLESHEYDPECKYCINNQFVKEATEAVRGIPELLKTKEEYNHTYIKLIDRLNVHQKLVEGAEKYVDLVGKKKELEMQLVSLENEIKMGKIQDASIKSLLSTLNEQRDIYLKNQHAIETNKRILSESAEIKQKRDNCEVNDIKLNKELQDALYTSSKVTAEYELCTERLKTYQEVSEKFRIYELYMKATCKEGVPYKIVEKALPVLESEVNSILSQIVDFSVKIDAVDDKYIGADIVYYGERCWPIEITSGMERFVLSLAFRAALMQMTTLAKSNFMVIDEGFGVLDSGNILQIGKLFNYLKDHFDFIVCVSHIDSMKDLTDKSIKISKTDGYSQINYDG